MKSIVLVEPGKFRLENVAEPVAPARDEVQVRVLQVGICGTDLHAFEGKQPFFTYPRILGMNSLLKSSNWDRRTRITT